MQILLLGYKIKNAVQISTPPEAKNFRDFHSQMQFSLNKLHFPDEKAPAFCRRRGKAIELREISNFGYQTVSNG